MQRDRQARSDDDETEREDSHRAPPGRRTPTAARSGGLPDEVRARMERAFNAEFANVRVHQDGQADAIGARAFARGNDLHFAPGAYAPGTPDGDALIGHELAHVVQQAEGRVASRRQAKGGAAVDDSAGLEREADDLGARAARGEIVRSGAQVSAVSGGVLQGKFVHDGADLQHPREKRDILMDHVRKEFARHDDDAAPHEFGAWLQAYRLPAADQVGAIEARDDARTVARPLEAHMRQEDRQGWNVGIYPTGAPIYKGMDPALDRIMSNDDIRNRFAASPGWFGDVDVAKSYAIRSTVKEKQKKHEPVGHLDQFDPTVASVGRFTARRDLVLFSLLHKGNVQRLLQTIEGKIEYQLDTPIGRWIRDNPQHWADWNIAQGQPDKTQLFELLRLLNKGAHRGKVHEYMRHAIRQARAQGDATVPLGLTDEQMRYMVQQKVGDQPSAEDGAAAWKGVRKKNVRAASKSIDEMLRLQRQWYALRFATGFGMGWEGQKQALGERQVKRRKLTEVGDYAEGEHADARDADRPIGPNPDQFNRISLMNRDLEVLKAIREHVNVDGYYALETPSLWHRDQHFHSEMAVHDPKDLLEFSGDGPSPDDVERLLAQLGH